MLQPNFPHLNLIQKERGDAKLHGGGSENAKVTRNMKNRRSHSQFLQEKFTAFSRHAHTLTQQREQNQLPTIEGGVPFMLQIPDEVDGVIEFIAETLGLEVVAEYVDGYLIVSTQDLDLGHVIQTAQDFSEKVRGSGQMANILDIDENPLSDNRIQRLLDDRLLEQWPFPDDQAFLLDVSIESAASGLPKKPRITKRTKPEVKAKKESKYAEALRQYQINWDDNRCNREQEIEAFVSHYDGEICHITDDSHLVDFPDSFSVRVRMSGKGFKDLIQNYPSLFEVSLPDNVQQPTGQEPFTGQVDAQFELRPPDQNSPTICVIDSGMQEQHRWLEAAIRSSESACFIPGKQPDDVADYVRAGGHGTRVAGAILYPQAVPNASQIQAPFWLLNARVLDDDNKLLANIFPAALLRKIVSLYKASCGTRIYNHSIAASCCCRIDRMSIWATEIDLLSYRDDILFIQATGNISRSNQLPNIPGILEHLQNNRRYPTYLLEPSSRIANPAQSLQALTVGSIATELYQDQNIASMAPTENPSAFTRTGFGLWDSIKPDVVEFGGDYAADTGNPPALTTPPNVCPELIRSTLNGGPPYARDGIGTSFAAPKVTHIAGQLAGLFPNRETLLYRALIVNSARWPQWAEQANITNRPNIVRSIGYGVPSLDRATENTANRITLITEQPYEIKAQEGYIFGIPIPGELRRPGDEFQIRIDVTLSYAAEPRRTRKARRGYLGVWVDWKASKRREPFDAFKGRALKDIDSIDNADDGNFPWTLGNKRERDGVTDGVTRKNGTLQKDWTIVNSYELPDMFGVVVRGHKGWARLDPEATAKFSLAVSFEALGAGLPIYTLIEQAIEVESEISLDAGQVEV